MADGPLEHVLVAIRLKAMGMATMPTGEHSVIYPAVDYKVLGRRLKENGSLTKMVKCASANYVSVLEVWQSAPEAIAVLQEMRKEATK
ncbi:hypothetical protein [Leuconostoc falkenbergense]|uniref:hypothetical protein n=1 Tax=Leuconostoc falkenbergense TaxID=2766470 RepID=UPI0028AA9600|nr:hypothetical protein [Leuconostoc falkenbergense]MDV8951189.1 hypothetical protein [Leuconostoc falkenbergense]